MDVITLNTKYIYAMGDIHGKFEEAVYNIINLNLSNSVIIVAGDCGIGFHKQKYYDSLFNKLNSKLKKINSILVFIRGNHDDPKYFNEQKYDLAHIKTIKDYTILSIHREDKAVYDILCIGGAISIDRFDRINYDFKRNLKIPPHKHHNNLTYWRDESFTLDHSKLDGMNSIKCVITHANPNHHNNIVKCGHVGYYCNYDENLEKDICKEYELLTEMINTLVLNNNIELWVNGHYHTHKKYYIDIHSRKIKCISLQNIENGVDIIEISK